MRRGNPSDNYRLWQYERRGRQFADVGSTSVAKAILIWWRLRHD
jgi:hypothetical protein